MKKNNSFFKIGPSLSFSSHSLSDNLNLTQQKTILENSGFSLLKDDDSFSNNENDSKKLESKISYVRNNRRNTAFNFPYYGNGSPIYNNPHTNRFTTIENQTIVSNVNSKLNFAPEAFSYPAEVYFSDKIIKESYEYNLPIGFMKKRQYYNPKYPSFNDQTYLDYGAVFWKSNIEIETNSSIEFTIPNNNQNNLILQIEGIDNQGNYLTEKITFDK